MLTFFTIFYTLDIKALMNQLFLKTTRYHLFWLYNSCSGLELNTNHIWGDFAP